MVAQVDNTDAAAPTISTMLARRDGAAPPSVLFSEWKIVMIKNINYCSWLTTGAKLSTSSRTQAAADGRGQSDIVRLPTGLLIGYYATESIASIIMTNEKKLNREAASIMTKELAGDSLSITCIYWWHLLGLFTSFSKSKHLYHGSRRWRASRAEKSLNRTRTGTIFSLREFSTLGILAFTMTLPSTAWAALNLISHFKQHYSNHLDSLLCKSAGIGKFTLCARHVLSATYCWLFLPLILAVREVFWRYIGPTQ